VGVADVAAGRAIYATGSNPGRASCRPNVRREMDGVLGPGVDRLRVLNAVRFSQIPSNAGIGWR
jgi:hypothetical protein